MNKSDLALILCQLWLSATMISLGSPWWSLAFIAGIWIVGYAVALRLDV